METVPNFDIIKYSAHMIYDEKLFEIDVKTASWSTENFIAFRIEYIRSDKAHTHTTNICKMEYNKPCTTMSQRS